MTYRMLQVGEAVPPFAAMGFDSRTFHSSAAYGKFLVLSFLGSLGFEKSRRVFDFAKTLVAPGGLSLLYAAVTVDRRDASLDPGNALVFADSSQYLSEMFGAIDPGACNGGTQLSYRPFSLVLDPSHRVVRRIALGDAEAHCASLSACVASLQESLPPTWAPFGAPLLQVPDVFDASLCQRLISIYQRNGGRDSGFMVARDGQTVGVVDHLLKRRSDFSFADLPEFEGLRKEIRARLKQALLPRIKDAFQFEATRMERYLVACYDEVTRGFFGPHRDNTTPGTAHRRFVCSINLNAEAYDAGDLRFPEFGRGTYRGGTGAAVVFSVRYCMRYCRWSGGCVMSFCRFL